MKTIKLEIMQLRGNPKSTEFRVDLRLSGRFELDRATFPDIESACPELEREIEQIMFGEVFKQLEEMRAALIQMVIEERRDSFLSQPVSIIDSEIEKLRQSLPKFTFELSLLTDPTQLHTF